MLTDDFIRKSVESACRNSGIEMPADEMDNVVRNAPRREDLGALIDYLVDVLGRRHSAAEDDRRQREWEARNDHVLFQGKTLDEGLAFISAREKGGRPVVLYMSTDQARAWHDSYKSRDILYAGHITPLTAVCLPGVWGGREFTVMAYD